MRAIVPVLAALAALLAALLALAPAASAAAVPTPEEFSWTPTRCTADPGGLNPELTVTVRDAYPGPLPITGTLVTPHGQPVVSLLKPGSNALLAPGTASSLQLIVQVQHGEGAITILTMRQSQWIGLCPAMHVGLPATGQPFWRGVVKPNPGVGGI